MGLLKKFFSQTETALDRKAKGLHVINELQRFRLLLCCLFCSCGVSLVYTFELFTSEFASKFGLSAGDQSTISTVGVAFCYFVVPYALLFEKTGATPLLLFAVVTGFIGTLGLALIFNGVIEGRLVIICVFYAIMNTCAGLFDASSIVTLQYNFPRNRGPVLGLAKVMTGLGSSVFASVKSNLFTYDVSGFIFFLMAFAVVVAFVGSFTLTLPPYEVNWWRARGKSREEIETLQSLSAVYYTKSVPMRRLGAGYVVGITLVAFFAITSPVVAYMDVPRSANYAIGALTIILVLCYFVMILPIKWLGGVNEPSPSALKEQMQRQHYNETGEDNFSAGTSQAAQDASGKPMPAGSEDDVTLTKRANKQKKIMENFDDEAEVAVEPARENPFAEYVEEITPAYTEPRYPGTIFDVLKHVDIYLIYAGFILQGAIGVIVMYNPSTIYVARTGQQRSAGLSALYTAFLGVGSAIGRIAIGSYEACVQRQKEGHRRFLVTTILPIPPLIGIIGGILILVLPGQALLLPYILVYFKEGAFYSTCAIIFPSLFGTHQSIYYNLSSATTVLCVIVFNRFLFGYIVDAQHNKLNYAKGEDCSETKCIMIPIIIAIVLCAVSAVLLLIVHLRYTRYVRRFEKSKQENVELGGSEEHVVEEDEEEEQEEDHVQALDASHLVEPTHDMEGTDPTDVQLTMKEPEVVVPSAIETTSAEERESEFSPREGDSHSLRQQREERSTGASGHTSATKKHEDTPAFH